MVKPVGKLCIIQFTMCHQGKYFFSVFFFFTGDTSQSLSQSHVTEEDEENEHSQDDTPGHTQNSQVSEFSCLFL